ncbi:alcohol dehydrogenase catalytic domain-containing protein [Nocardiopsis baichengensis]|uniref:alcohol dehydrogenase catalytic domain-containing protein n=1 Tax=Nocardiopsis baichengensis TaxID=280240 RepID=UPI000349DA23|nr:alcohol dehydrogenase catalytic domain-containing protein [Nocardiopsis baichengensis]
MRVSAAVLDRGAVRVEELLLPERAPGEIDVHIDAAAVCGSDLHTVLGRRPAPERTVLGHEGAGTVAAADPGTRDLRGTPLRPGDRVVFARFGACGTCDRCTRGLEAACRSVLTYGHEGADRAPHATGTLADGVRLLPGVPVLRVPGWAGDAHVVSAGCAAATAAAVLSAGGAAEPGDPALVLGAGAVGAYCAAMLRSEGRTVYVHDPAPRRSAAVRRLGARTDVPDGLAFPLVVEASGSPEAFAAALGAAEAGGRVVAASAVGPGTAEVRLDPADLAARHLTVAGVHGYAAADFLRGVDWLLGPGQFLDLEALVSPPVPLPPPGKDLDEAFGLMHAGEHLRVLVAPPAA